jgi:hypothetical protein
MPTPSAFLTPEHARLAEARHGPLPWKRWGPYLSERQWGTVREDYSDHGDAWGYFTHDHSRSRAYRWGEDGLAGISDEQQRLCFAVALWNGTDPILKERLFGLTNAEGNHGEDVKEYYFYLDSTPTHSYMRYLYKYPQAAFPYADLIEGNRHRNRHELEYELLDTGVFEGNRYFDVFVEYAKAGPTDILVEIRVVNRGPEAARACVLPTIWFRNIWSTDPNSQRPRLKARTGNGAQPAVAAWDPELGDYVMACDGDCTLLFTENETNTLRLFGTPNSTPYVKDGINDAVVHGRAEAVNPALLGTKAAAYYDLTVPSGGTRSVRLRIADANSASIHAASSFGREFDDLLKLRRDEADGFYATVIPSTVGADVANVMRQALAGMLWTKQYYYYDVDVWLGERGSDPFSHRPLPSPRNEHWHHMRNAHIISMPDKWEYPWYAAWDLAFHVLPLALVDEGFAKDQLSLMLNERYQHPSGQLPAYEWNFGDANPPVHAFATFHTYALERARNGRGDVEWLERSFHKLAINFTWWVNRKDRHGHNAFEGGFLGLDNIGVFDRSAPLPTGGYLEQADGTAWMVFFCQNMVEISAELAMHDPSYSDMCVKFVEHFFWIATAMMHAGDDIGMWDEEDGFFYDVLRMPDGHAIRLKVRSMVGLLPLCATTVFEGTVLERLPDVRERCRDFLKARPEMRAFIHDPAEYGSGRHLMQSVLNERNLRRMLRIMLDEGEFLSPFGIRALSRYHAEHPYTFWLDGREYRVSYAPAESETSMFGGNSNWRGPVWMPLNILIVRALLQYFIFYGKDFTVECPTGSGRQMNLYQVAEEITRRLSNIFERNAEGARPVYGGARIFQDDPHWRDLILFYEYFHGDNGAGLGAGHQTGWTGAIAFLQHRFATSTPEQYLEIGKHANVVEIGTDLPEPVQALRGAKTGETRTQVH